MNAKNSVIAIFVEAIIYLLYSLHYCTLKADIGSSVTHKKLARSRSLVKRYYLHDHSKFCAITISNEQS